MAEIEIEVARAGTFKDMNHREIVVDSAMLDELVTSYDEEKGGAPLVFGHPKDNGPAYGWVKSLRRQGNVLLAKIGDIPDTVRSLVASKTYRHVSISYWPRQHSSSPAPATHYLRHIGLLGASAPAIPGLAEIKFAGTDGDAVTIDFAIAPEDVAPGTELRGVLDKLLDGLRHYMSDEEIAAMLPEEDRTTIMGDAAQPVDAAAFSTAFASLNSVIGDGLSRVKKLEEEATDLAAHRSSTANRKAVDQAVSEGRIAPFMVPRVHEFMAALDDSAPVSFSSGGAFEEETTTIAEQFRQFIKSQPPFLPLGNFSASDQSSDESDTMVTRAVKIAEHVREAKERGVVMLASQAAEELGFFQENDQ